MNSYLIIYTLNTLYEFPMRVNRNTGPDMNYQIQLNSIEFVIIKVHLLVEKAI